MIPSDCHHTNCTPYERVDKYEAGKTVNMKCDSYVFTFTIWHTSGEFLIVKAPGVGVDEQDKGPGKALTYATKNAWLKALMLKSGDDPDTHPPEQHQKHQNQQAQQRQYPQLPPQQTSQQPSSNAQKPSGGTLTSSPSTWPPDWQNLLEKAVASAKDVHAIDKEPEFKIITLLTKAKEQIMSRNPPAVILDEVMRRIAGFTMNSAIKTTHAEVMVKDILENWLLFEKYLGGASEKTAATKKLLEDWVPF
jgi:hypothetical protein